MLPATNSHGTSQAEANPGSGALLLTPPSQEAVGTADKSFEDAILAFMPCCTRSAGQRVMAPGCRWASSERALQQGANSTAAEGEERKVWLLASGTAQT